MTLLATKFFFNNNCKGTPDVVTMVPDSECAAEETCKLYNSTEDGIYTLASCITDRLEFASTVFAEVNFVAIEQYNKTGCDGLVTTNAFPAFGKCQLSSTDGKSWMITTLDGTTGDINMTIYDDTTTCGGSSSTEVYTATGSNVSTRELGYCIIDDMHKFYSSISLREGSTSSSASESSSNTSDSSSNAVSITSNSGSSITTEDTNSQDSSISTGAIIGIIVAVLVAVVFIIVGFLWYRRRSKASGDSDKLDDNYARVPSPVAQKSIDTVTTDFSSSIGLGPQSLAGLWDDEIIATSRIPRDKVLVQQLISRGGYGEVYYGLYSGQRVALKMLQPELRKSIKHVNEFLDEVRLMALLDHPRIVRFVGVAWDSLSDLCAVLEYMEGGDLRALLTSYETQRHALGFDTTKVTIALHVAHGLTYLHSLDPPVLHRDLKSKNILLTSDLQAKITDFGISRERTDKTMTAGVGTSLWMAPEVMLGQRYDGKADMFSFGVVLSELDQHTLPYSHVKQNSDSGRKIPETAILQMVALGQIRVKFSSEALESMVALGNACVAVDPNERPTAAEALYRLQRILREDL